MLRLAVAVLLSGLASAQNNVVGGAKKGPAVPASGIGQFRFAPVDLTAGSLSLSPNTGLIGSVPTNFLVPTITAKPGVSETIAGGKVSEAIAADPALAAQVVPMASQKAEVKTDDIVGPARFAPARASVKTDSQGSGGGSANIQFLEKSGPIWQIRYSPDDAPAALEKVYSGADFGGRKPVHVLFGGGNNKVFNRPWVSKWTKAAIEEARKEIPGLELLVVDMEGHLPPAEDRHRGLEADISDAKPANVKAVAEKILRWAQENNAVIVGANAILNPFIPFPPMLQTLARDSGHNPAIEVNPVEAVDAARVKTKTRAIVGQHVPGLRLASRVIEHPKDIPLSEAADYAVRMFEEMLAQNPGSRFIMKPEQSAGKVGVRPEIATAAQAREAFLSIHKELNEYWDKHPEDRAMHTVQENPRITMERMIEAHGEYDVEMVWRRNPQGGADVIAFIIGNPKSEPVSRAELGMTFPAMLSPELQRALITAAADAVSAVWKYFRFVESAMGMLADLGPVPFGNFHVEVMLENGTTPQLIEINATRPVGGNVVIPLIKDWSGLDLPRLGARAALGLSIEAPEKQPEDAAVIRKITPAYTGHIDEVVVPDGLRETPGLQGLVYSPKDSEVFAPQDNQNGFSSIGYVMTRGATQEEATAKAFDVMRQVKVKIKTPSGEIKEQPGDAFHSPDDEIRLPAPGVSGAGVPPPIETGSGLPKQEEP